MGPLSKSKGPPDMKRGQHPRLHENMSGTEHAAGTISPLETGSAPGQTGIPQTEQIESATPPGANATADIPWSPSGRFC
jgi:hypothetical protein